MSLNCRGLAVRLAASYVVWKIEPLLILFSVLCCIFVVKKAWPLFERGMFCDDSSIRYPYTDHETVSDTMLLLFGVAMPVALVSWEDNTCFHTTIHPDKQTLLDPYQALDVGVIVEADMTQRHYKLILTADLKIMLFADHNTAN